MISYKKLFLIMEEREISKEKLKNETGISSATLAKLSKNEDVSMATVQSICEYLDCQPGAILSYEKNIDENSAIFRLREEMEMKLISFFIQRDVLSRHSGIINQKDRCRKAGYSSANDVGVPFFYTFRCGSLVKQIVNVHGIHSFLKSFQNSVEITTLSIL